MALLELAVLGPLTIRLAGQPLAAPLYAKTRALLAYLAVEADRPHHRDTLAALLWPEQDTPHARLNLRKALSQLRSALGAGGARLLICSRDTVRLDPSQLQIDAALFAQARACEGEGEHEGQARALALYQGPFLDQLIVGDSVPFTEWQVLVRERLHRRAVESCGALSAHFAAAGRWEDACTYAQRHLELEPWDEGAHRSLMRALAASGQRVAALRQFERCRQMLAAEFGVEPEAATMALLDELRAGRGEAATSTQARAGEEPPGSQGSRPLAPFDNLPAPTTTLVGRARTIAELTATLGSGEARLLTLTGTVGCGKTRLALAAAAASRGRFRDGACFVPLAEVREPAMLVAALLRTLGLDARGLGAQPPDRLLIEALRERQLLLILDSCEHLGTVAPLVSLLLAACPGLTILCTSRIALRIYGEWHYGVPPLPVPPLRVECARVALACAAVELFVLRARAAAHDFDLSDADAPAVAGICARLDGLPLAIELAAAQMGRLSPAALLAQLERRLAQLAGGPRDVPAHHRSLGDAIGWSYSLLTPGQQALLRRLGALDGAFTVREARAALGLGPNWELQAELETLIEHNLLRRGGEHEPRYELWATMRAFVREHEATRDESEARRYRFDTARADDYAVTPRGR